MKKAICCQVRFRRNVDILSDMSLKRGCHFFSWNKAYRIKRTK
jgi:hypothetical protein